MRILVFGDSIGQGMWDIQGGWVQRLASHYAKATIQNLDGEWVEFFNLSVDGNVTRQVLERFEAEIKLREWPGDPMALVFAIGINDALVIDGNEKSTPEAYYEQLSALLKQARPLCDIVLFVGTSAVDEARLNPWRYSQKDVRANNERIAQFNAKLVDFCAENKVPLVKVFESFIAEMQKQELLLDGLHPNDAGHELIASLVRPELDKLIS